jgi:hypothetical protein
MFYIHHTSCISPQQTFGEPDLSVVHPPGEFKLKVIEPKYEGIPLGVLRRMSLSVRIGIGAAQPLLKIEPAPAGIIIGTANAGFEDCFLFLKQMVDYEEGLLTPGNFVQSTPNALAAQLGMLNHNHNYNITHVHHGLAFENAMIDAGMHCRENPGSSFLLGAVDDIASYNYNINFLGGWYKKESSGLHGLFGSGTPGSIAGEGAAMFLVNGHAGSALALVAAVSTVHSVDGPVVEQAMKNLLEDHLKAGEKIDLLISGEDGDSRLDAYYHRAEALSGDAGVVRFKHMSGSYPTASAMALWIACFILGKGVVPGHMIKKKSNGHSPGIILIYNNFKGAQHSFILVRRPE